MSKEIEQAATEHYLRMAKEVYPSHDDAEFYMLLENDTPNLAKAIVKAIQTFAASHPVEGDGWIRVEDRLPEKTGYYLAYDTNYDEQNGIEVYRYDSYNQSWLYGADCFHPQYWMPLPNKPKD